MYRVIELIFLVAFAGLLYRCWYTRLRTAFLHSPLPRAWPCKALFSGGHGHFR